MNKQLLILGLASLLILSFIPIVESVDISTIEIVSSKSTVEKEDIFNITVRFINENETIDFWKLNMTYDSSLVSLMDARVSYDWNGSGALCEIIPRNDSVFAQAFAMNPVYTNTIFFEMTFKAIESGTAHFNFAQLPPETIWYKVGYVGETIKSINLINCTVTINAPAEPPSGGGGGGGGGDVEPPIPPVNDTNDTVPPVNNTNQTNDTVPPDNDTMQPINDTNQTQPQNDTNQTEPQNNTNNQTDIISPPKDDIILTIVAIGVFIIAIVLGILWFLLRFLRT